MTCYDQFISAALLRGEALSSLPPPRRPGRWCRVGCDLPSSPSLSFLLEALSPRSASCPLHVLRPPRWPRLLSSLPCWLSPPLPALVLTLLFVCLPAPAPRLLAPAVQTGCPVPTPLGCPMGALSTSCPESAPQASVHVGPSLQVADPFFQVPRCIPWRLFIPAWIPSQSSRLWLQSLSSI